MSEYNNIDRELGWDDIIENEGDNFEPLPTGEYPFEVMDFERGRYNGGAKIPACAQAVVKLKIVGTDGMVREVNDYLILHTKMEWKLCEFFLSIGQRKKGEPLKMNWGKVVGAKGRAKVIIREKTGNNGNKMLFNNIDKYLPPAEPPAKAGGFVPGKF